MGFELLLWYVKVQRIELFPWWKAVNGSASAVQKSSEMIFFVKKQIRTNAYLFLEGCWVAWHTVCYIVSVIKIKNKFIFFIFIPFPKKAAETRQPFLVFIRKSV